MLAGELALEGVGVAIVERRQRQELEGLRAGGLHIRTIEALDQRGIADRFISQGRVIRSVPFALTSLDVSDQPTAITTISGSGRIASKVRWPTGLASCQCQSIADAK